MTFANQKNQRFEHTDLSKKGSVDEAIIELVDHINSLPQYFTTSSCSGRILVYENPSPTVDKKCCKWLYVTHSSATFDGVVHSLSAAVDEAVFKFEPFIMHVQCKTLEDAQEMHKVAVSSGFRNSGITIGGKGKIIMAVRGTHSLEAPVSSKGSLIVSEQYIQYLITSANKKMEENFNRIKRFYDLVQSFQPSEIDKKQAKIRTCREKKNLATTETDQTTKTEETADDCDLELFVFDIT